MLDLEPAAREIRRLLAGVTQEHLAAPTPCAGTPVAGLLDHLMALAQAFTWAADKTGPPGGGQPSASAEALDPYWRMVLPRRLEALVEAWRAPSAWEGTADAGGVTMPAEVMGLVALDELVLHGWDLARATGQSFEVDPASAAAVLEFAAETATPEQAHLREGLFGPVVPVPPDAPVFHRALGLAGRDPAWSPSPAGIG